MEFLIPKNRVRLVFCLLVFLHSLIVVKVVYLNLSSGEELARKRDAQRKRIINYPAIRGSVLDSKGAYLALDVPVKAVYVEPRRVEKPDAVVALLTSVLKVSRSEVLEKLISKRPLEWVGAGADEAALKKIEKAGLKGIGLDTVQSRSYPQGESGASIVGVKGRDEGLEGIELVYEKTLAGQPGYALLEKDAIGKNVPNSTREKVPGKRGADINLTIDLTIQHIAETELQKAMEEHNAAGGSVVVLQPATGRVLALASAPSFNPAKPTHIYRSRPVSYVYEPGSTLKLVVAAAAVEFGKMPITEKKFLCMGSLAIGPNRIGDAHPSPKSTGMLSLLEIIRYSSNVGAAQVGMRMGAGVMKAMLKRFGFGQKLGIELNGEERGLLPSESSWGRNITVATVSYGQGVSATPLQMASAYAAVANGGSLMKPSIVERIAAEDGEILYQFQPKEIKRAVSPASAKILNKMLVDVTEEGTGGNAKVDGFTVAGKTGTAQIARSGGYASGEYISSYVGYVPAEDPQLLIMAILEKPRGAYYGGAVAAPVFREVAKRTLWYLKVEPTRQTELVSNE